MRAFVILVVIALLTTVSLASSTAPPQAKPKPKPKADPISGEWDAVITGPNNTLQFTLKLKLEGAKVTGASESSHLGNGAISDGSWANNKLKITIETRHAPMALTGALRRYRRRRKPHKAPRRRPRMQAQQPCEGGQTACRRQEQPH